MYNEISKLRLYALRLLYLLTCVGLAPSTWMGIINPGGLWEPLPGVAMSFWAAYSVLMGLGVFFPVKMLPLVLLQLFYKSTWVLGIGLPLWFAGTLEPLSDELFMACLIGATVDLLVIPWPFLFKKYFRSDQAMSQQAVASVHPG